MRNKTLLLIFFTLLTLYSMHIPFFWDGTFFSELSVFFYENGYNGFIAPQQTDTGGFPLFSVYITFIWKIFGKTLPVSHIAMLPFLIGIAYEYLKLAKRFLNEKILPFALLLLLLEPTFITQSILMGYDLLMLYFFLLALNALLSNKHKLYSISLLLLCMSSVRGIILGISLLIIDAIINLINTKKLALNFRSYFFVSAIILFWAIYHKEQTGWFLFSPERENTDEVILPFTMMLRQFIFIGWKLVDFGRIILWLFLMIGIFIYRRRNNSADLNTLLLIIFIPIVVTAAFMIPLSNPIGHRYFMFAYLLLIFGVCYILQQIKNIKIIYSLIIVFALTLLSGNFWLYPERLGNGWDSSLKVIPYFKLKDNMDDYIIKNNIAAEDVGTQFPLIADKRFSHLLTTSYHYINVWRGPIDNYRYFLQSNIINTDIPEQFEEVKNNWDLLKEFKSGQVYLRLYKNKITSATSQ